MPVPCFPIIVVFIENEHIAIVLFQICHDCNTEKFKSKCTTDQRIGTFIVLKDMDESKKAKKISIFPMLLSGNGEFWGISYENALTPLLFPARMKKRESYAMNIFRFHMKNAEVDLPYEVCSAIGGNSRHVS